MGSVAQRFEADRTKFPGLLVDEILVWKAWLAQHQTEFDRFDYNVRLGYGNDPGESFPQATRNMAVQLTQLRIDAVGWHGTQPTIFEIKRRAYPPAVGQLISYDAMWRSQQLSAAPPLLRLVCSDYTRNIEPAVQENNIQLDVVPVNFSVLASTDPRT